MGNCVWQSCVFAVCHETTDEDFDLHPFRRRHLLRLHLESRLKVVSLPKLLANVSCLQSLRPVPEIVSILRMSMVDRMAWEMTGATVCLQRRALPHV